MGKVGLATVLQKILIWDFNEEDVCSHMEKPANSCNYIEL